MSRKDYIAIAAAIRQGSNFFSVGETPDTTARSRAIAERLADLFAGDNPRFNRATFMTACGLED